MPAIAAVQVIETIDQAAALLDSTRLRLVRELNRPDSAAGLAKRIGLPRQQINYHLRELERVGLISLVEKRPRGNCIERVVVATATAYVVDPRILAELGGEPSAVQDQFSWAYLVAVAAKAIKDLAELRRGADTARQKLATFAFDMPVRLKSPTAAQAFYNDLATALVRLANQHHDEKSQDGRLFRLFGGAYTALTRTNDAAKSPSEGEKVSTPRRAATRADSAPNPKKHRIPKPPERPSAATKSRGRKRSTPTNP